ncbi:hypothetical protein [Clostridium sp. CTA-6]
MVMTIEEFKHQFDDCKSVDGEYDLSKKYRFSYKKLIEDDRIQSSSFHSSWTSSLKEYDGTIVTLIDEHEGNIDNKFSIARNWCEEII